MHTCSSRLVRHTHVPSWGSHTQVVCCFAGVKWGLSKIGKMRRGKREWDKASKMVAQWFWRSNTYNFEMHMGMDKPWYIRYTWLDCESWFSHSAASLPVSHPPSSALQLVLGFLRIICFPKCLASQLRQTELLVACSPHRSIYLR
jgi:hypothetical protein